jgi:hypothetical protein
MGALFPWLRRVGLPARDVLAGIASALFPGASGRRRNPTPDGTNPPEGERDDPLANERRRLAPGLVVSFARGFDFSGSGRPLENRLRFPQLETWEFADASPDLLAFVAAASAADGRTVGAIARECAQRAGVPVARLYAFAALLSQAGYLDPAPPPARWAHLATAEETAPEPIASTRRYHLPEGSGFVVDAGAFLWFDHGGALRLRLRPAEMIAMRHLGEAQTPDQAWAAVSAESAPMSRAEFEALLERLWSAGLLRRAAGAAQDRTAGHGAEQDARALVLTEVLASVAEFERRVGARPGRRAAVVPVNDDHKMAPLSLGLLLAYAQELDGGRLTERYDFVPLFLAEEATLVQWAQRPAVFLFSNYIWNLDRNLRLSAAIKRANPSNLMVHGGPSTPKYRGDCERFFADNPHVDITVRGEGEATFAAILDALDPGALDDRSPLRAVAGLSFRDPCGAVVHTPDRPRIADLDTIPSPYLLGFFEPFGRAHVAAVVESNRGCPYGCTFCDWGSATLSRIRKFDLDRVKRELEWLSRHELMFVALCDANFGIFERDVEIAQYIAAMKRTYGYPQTAALNYAKNTMRHLRPIIQAFADAGLTIQPSVALQTLDEPTLKTIRRSNIKLSQYDELASEFRRSALPLATDIMMGLPGSTVDSFKTDLQKCTDRDIRARCNPTLLLPNSPMNEPGYRAEHGIVAAPHDIIRETKTFTRAEWDEMERLRVAFYVLDNFGVLRHLARFVRSEVGLKEVAFYDRVSRAAANPRRWPFIAAVFRMMEAHMAPPGSWALFLDDVRRLVVEEIGVESGSALDAAVAVQRAHMPAADRILPVTIELPHDYVAWHTAMLEIRADDHGDDWEQFAPRLRSFGPGQITVSDPSDICGTMVGKALLEMVWTIRGWELVSPVARAQYQDLTPPSDDVRFGDAVPVATDPAAMALA